MAVCVLFLLSAAIAFGQDAPAVAGRGDPSLSAAQNLEKSGKTDAAFSAFEKWLSTNTSSTDYVGTLLHAATIAPTIGQCIALLQEGLVNVKDHGDRSRILAAMAASAELAGNIEHAQQSYEAAYLESPSSPERYAYLLQSAKLLFEMGRLSDAESRIALIRSTLATAASGSGAATETEAALLGARITAAKSGAAAGLAAAQPILANEAAGADVYLFVAETAHAAGKDAVARDALGTLKKKFGDSPEAALAAKILGAPESGVEGKIGYLPSPSQVFASVAPGSQPSAPDEGTAAGKHASAPPDNTGGASGAETAVRTDAIGNVNAHAPERKAGEPVTSLAIQTGAFTNPENAKALVKELSARGYQSETRTVSRGDTIYYQVVVPVTAQPGTSPADAAQHELIKLKGDGFEGFLVGN